MYHANCPLQLMAQQPKSEGAVGDRRFGLLRSGHIEAGHAAFCLLSSCLMGDPSDWWRPMHLGPLYPGRAIFAFKSRP